MTRGSEALGKHGLSVDALLFEYLHRYSNHNITTEPDPERTGWNNAIEFIASNIICNADFSQWLVDQFHDKETGEAYVNAFSEFIRKDLFANEKES